MRPTRILAALAAVVIRILAALAAVVVLTGCASVTTDGQPDEASSFLAEVTKFTVADLALAHELALKATDPGAPYRARCWATLLEWVPSLGGPVSTPEPIGLVSAYEIGAELAAKARGGQLVPERVRADCDYVRAEFRRFALRQAAKVAPVPGAGALGTILK